MHGARSTEYKHLLTKYEKQQKTLKKIVAFIQDSIFTINETLIERVNLNPYDMLVALKQRLASIIRTTKLAIEQDYHHMCKGPKIVKMWDGEWINE